MRMIGFLPRVTPNELARAQADLDWASRLQHEISAADDPDDRLLSAEKAWHAISFLLQRTGFRVLSGCWIG